MSTSSLTDSAASAAFDSFHAYGQFARSRSDVLVCNEIEAAPGMVCSLNNTNIHHEGPMALAVSHGWQWGEGIPLRSVCFASGNWTKASWQNCTARVSFSSFFTRLNNSGVDCSLEWPCHEPKRAGPHKCKGAGVEFQYNLRVSSDKCSNGGGNKDPNRMPSSRSSIAWTKFHTGH